MTTKISELPSAQNIGVPSNGAINFSSTTSGAGSKDVGLSRASAGNLKVTDGSSGSGALQTSSLVLADANGQLPTISTRDNGGGASALTYVVGGNGVFKADASGIHINDKVVGFNNGFGGTSDVAFGPYSLTDKVIKVTDGSTGVRGLLGGGSAVASASALPLPTGRVFHVTGTTNITSITATNLQAGVVITLIFDGVLTFTDGNNLKLAGNFVTTADDTITLAYDGTNFYEVCRSVN